MPNGYCYEVEIKISRSDFKADFKKVKHNIHSTNQNGKKHYLVKNGEQRDFNPSWELCRDYPDLIESNTYESPRHGVGVQLKMTVSSRIEIRDFKNKRLPNKFFYAVPKGLISKEEVPDYAGLLYIDENLKVSKVKDGKFIHKDKLPVEKIFNKVYYAYEKQLIEKFKL